MTLLYQSPALQPLWHRAMKAAATDQTVLLTGETGCGKSALAEAIHRCSPRAAKPFNSINMASLPRHILESELFGHKRGSFTGALNDRKGLIQQADGSTLLLDEIGEMPMESQAVLLKAIEEKTVRRVGDNTNVAVNVRFLFATSQDLKLAITEKRFSEALYYRIADKVLHIPPLRDRPADIVPLAEHFLESNPQWSMFKLSDAAKSKLMAHCWPGNLRELQHAVKNAVHDAHETTTLEPQHFPAALTELPKAPKPPMPTLTNYVNWSRRGYVQDTIERANGNKKEAARVLGISMATLYRVLEEA